MEEIAANTIRTCQGCGRVLNMKFSPESNYCRSNPDCLRINKRECNRRVKRGARARAPGKWELPEDDGYIDDVAVDLAVNGVRNVRLTHRERVACVKRMLKMPNLGPMDISHRIGVNHAVLHEIFDELGWEVVKDPLFSSATDKAVVVVRKDRPRKKMLDSGPFNIAPIPAHRRLSQANEIVRLSMVAISRRCRAHCRLYCIADNQYNLNADRSRPGMRVVLRSAADRLKNRNLPL